MILVLSLAYAVLARAGLQFSTPPDYISPVWPLSGIALPVLQRYGLRWWPAVFIGDSLVSHWLGFSAPMTLGLSTAATIEPVLGVVLLRQRADFHEYLDRPADVLYLVLIAGAISTFVSACCAATTLVAGGVIAPDRAPTVAMNWWVGDCMGVLVVAPGILTWSADRRWSPRRGRLIEALLFGLALLSLTSLVFRYSLLYSYLLYPFFIWAALRFGQHGVTAALIAISPLTVVFTAAGEGPFVAGTATSSLVFLQIFLAILGITALVLGALIAQRQRAAATQQLLADIDTLCAQGSEEQQLLADAATRCASTLADWCVIYMIGPDRLARRIAIACADPAKVELAAGLHHFTIDLYQPPSTSIARALNGEPQLLARMTNRQLAEMTHASEHYALLRALGVHSRMIVPFVVRGHVIGGIVISAGASRRRYDDDDLNLARQLASRLAEAIDIAQLERNLQQAQKLESLGRLAGGIAHDFNNLLTIINGNADLAIEALQSGQIPIDDLHQIQDASQRAADLTRQLLIVGRRQPYQPRPSDLNGLIRDVYPLLRRLIREDIEFLTQLAPELPLITIDKAQFEQVLTNLVINARDAMPQGGKLIISTSTGTLDQIYPIPDRKRSDRLGVLLAIQDTGTGMDAATRAQLFEPFFSTKAPGHGTGLGLATVYGIVQRSEGQIRVDSQVGQGSTFTIYLPTTDDLDLPPDSDVNATPDPPAIGTILVVEDDPI
jgi:signal transduction histidine kinase